MAIWTKPLDEISDDELAVLAVFLVSGISSPSFYVISEVIIRWQILRGAARPPSHPHRES